MVVIYAENRSFNNLFANFPGVEKPLSALTAADYTQYDRDGTALPALPPVGGMVPQSQQANHITYQVDQAAPYMNNLANAPFALRGPQGEPLPQGVVTRDLWHVFYQNQMQINGGKNDRFVAWADSGGLVMGYYSDSAYNLRLWKLAQEFTLCDNFFQGAFGGSFLNHQYLVAAQPPVYPDAANSVAKVQIAQLQSADPTDTRLQPKPTSPASALTGSPQFGPSALSPDGFGVNTMGPPYWPAFSRSAADPTQADPANPMTMVPQGHANIGDLMTAKGLDCLVRRRLAGRRRFHRQHRLSGLAQLPGASPALQLLQEHRARHTGAHGASARRRPGRHHRDQQIPGRRRGRQAATADLLQAAGQSQHACRLRGRGVGRPPHRPHRRQPAQQPAMEEHGGGHHRGREWRLVGPRRAAQGRPLGPARAFRRW